MLFHLKDFTSVKVLSISLNWPPLDPEKTVLVFVNTCYECCSMAVVSGNTLISPHLFPCHWMYLFPCHWMLSQLWLWSCAGFAWQRCVGLCPAGFPRGSRKQQVPKVLVLSAAGVQWEGAGVQLSTARDQQQLLQQAGLSLGFPFCHSKPLMRLSNNGGLWCFHRVQNAPGIPCRTGCAQGGQEGPTGPGWEPCSASDTSSCEHPLRLQAEISSCPSGLLLQQLLCWLPLALVASGTAAQGWVTLQGAGTCPSPPKEVSPLLKGLIISCPAVPGSLYVRLHG